MKNRPSIVFRRTLNPGLSPREAKFDKNGKQTRAANPGQFTEEWEKALISHRAPYDPYTWATADWIYAQISKGRVPVAIKHFDSLPANYPKEWAAKLQMLANIVKPAISSGAAADEAIKRNEELKKRLDELEAKQNEQKADVSRSRKSDRPDAGEVEGSSSKTGEGTNVAAN